MRRALSSIIISTSLLSLSAFAAQADVPGNPNILAAVQDLQASQASQNATLTAIQTALTNIQSTINGLTPVQGNVRITPPIHWGVGNPSLLCLVRNVANAPRTIRMELILEDGSSDLGSEKVVGPGKITSSGLIGSPTTRAYSSCKFTVIDGTQADIRGLAEVFSADLSLLAAVPAE